MSSSETTQTKQSIDFAELEKPIQEIITLTNKIDERYREKCFEILLNFYLMEKTGKPITVSVKEELEKKEEVVKESFEVPIDVRAFLIQQSIPEDVISKLFFIAKGEIRPIYNITTGKKSEGQIQVALLTALENAIKAPSNKFEFSVENIRTRCQKLNVYDIANFTAVFKRNGRLFNGLDDEEHVELSPVGQTELAETIILVTKQ
jgi:hypothetical protein